MNKAYIVCLKYGTWRNELWFSAPDDEKTAEKWRKTVDGLPFISRNVTNSNDYMSESVKFFEENGFTRIQR